MPVLLTGSDAYVQFITVLVIFVVVLGVCAYTTKWLADYQKKQGRNKNIDVVEVARLGNNKWIQVIRIGKSYKAIAVCKDTVTFLGDIPKEEISLTDTDSADHSFKDFLTKAISKNSGKNAVDRDDKSDE